MKTQLSRRTYVPEIVDTSRARLPQKNYADRLIASGPAFKLTGGFSPIVLTSGEVSVGEGAIATPDHGRLQPLERTAMIVDEIHFNARVAHASVAWDSRWILRAQISSGRHAVTNGFVPLAGLEYEYLTNALSTARTLAGTDYANTAITGTRWKLPVPLYVPAGSILFTQLLLSPAVSVIAEGATTLVANVSYIGRLLPVDYPVPATIRVPYATSIQSADTTEAGALLESQNLQLGNPFDVPFYAQRFVMRTYESRNYGGNLVFVQAYDGGSPPITIRGTFSNEDVLLADRVNHYAIFDDGITPGTLGTLGHHVMNLHNLEMRPKDRFDLTIDSRAATVFPPDTVAALIGWRNEVI